MPTTSAPRGRVWIRQAEQRTRGARAARIGDRRCGMDAVALVRNRVGAVNANLHAVVGRAGAVDWVTPVAPRLSPIGLTLWHIPRTHDWLLNTCIRTTPEAADRPEFASLPDPNQYGFGTGLTPAEASTAAGAVDADLLLRYADQVHGEFDAWLGSLGDEDLDAPVAGFDERQNARPSRGWPGLARGRDPRCAGRGLRGAQDRAPVVLHAGRARRGRGPGWAAAGCAPDAAGGLTPARPLRRARHPASARRLSTVLT